MTAEQKLPGALVPADVDLRDFEFMPLDVRRLRDSRFIATRTPEEIVAGILLWSASWHQQPASSLPDDDVELSQLAGYGRATGEFKRIKEGALHQFVRCDDGRYYHPVVAEKAAYAWNSKLVEQWRRAADLVRKSNKDRKDKGLSDLPLPERPHLLVLETSAGIPRWRYLNSAGIPQDGLRNSRLKRQGQCKGQGQGQKEERARGTRLTREAEIPPAWKAYCAEKRPDLDPAAVYENFCDYWTPKTSDATKLDWLATWRTWVRKERGPGGKPPPRGAPAQDPGKGVGPRGNF